MCFALTVYFVIHLSQGLDFVFSPTVKALYPGNLDYYASYSIKTSNDITDATLKTNYSVEVSAFRLRTSVSSVHANTLWCIEINMVCSVFGY